MIFLLSSLQETLLFGLKSIILPEGCHSCWIKSRIKEVSPDWAGISSLIDIVKAIADSDVTFEEHE